MFYLLTRLSDKFSANQKRIIGNTGWLLGSKVIRAIVSLFISALIARYLQPEGYGQLQYALAFCSFFVPLSTAQVGNIVVRDLVEKPEQKYKTIGTAFTLQVLGGFVAAAFAIGSIFLISPADRMAQLLVTIIALKFILVSYQPIENWFDAKVASKFNVFAANIAFALITAVEFTLVLQQAPLFAFAVTFVLESLIYGTGLLFFYCRDRQNPLKWRTDFAGIKYLLIESFPICLSSTSSVLYKNLDRVMLANLIGSQSVGIYSSAATLSESLSFLPMVICVSLYPTLIRSKALEASAYQARLQKMYDLITLVAYSLILTLVPLSGFVVTFIFGSSYQAAVPIFALYLWSALFTFLGVVQSRWAIAEGLQTFNLYARLTGLGVNLLLNLVLIPRYEALGATIATIISYAIGNYLFFFLMPQTRPNAVLMTRSLCLPFRLPQLLRSLRS